MAAAVFISVGAVAAPNLREQLADLDEPLVFAGSGVQVVGLLAALLFSAASLTRRSEAEGDTRTRSKK